MILLFLVADLMLAALTFLLLLEHLLSVLLLLLLLLKNLLRVKYCTRVYRSIFYNICVCVYILYIYSCVYLHVLEYSVLRVLCVCD
jgi:hypothetical protein